MKDRLYVQKVMLSIGGVASREDSEVIKSSLEYIQLEKQNERLKEALIKLRDVTSETEHDQRKRIMEMEKDVGEFEELQGKTSRSFFRNCLLNVI